MRTTCSSASAISGVSPTHFRERHVLRDVLVLRAREEVRHPAHGGRPRRVVLEVEHHRLVRAQARGVRRLIPSRRPNAPTGHGGQPRDDLLPHAAGASRDEDDLLLGRVRRGRREGADRRERGPLRRERASGRGEAMERARERRHRHRDRRGGTSGAPGCDDRATPTGGRNNNEQRSRFFSSVLLEASGVAAPKRRRIGRTRLVVIFHRAIDPSRLPLPLPPSLRLARLTGRGTSP
jgi:hypothetical protein